jgi:NAD(P)H-hydrate epimerase
LVTAGGPELATIGTGDVLSGALAALWARGLDADVAARSAAFWHGIAGADLARSGAFSAGDLAGHLSRYSAV